MHYLPVIGLEIHVEPTTKSKMFCGCKADHFSKPANTQTCPVCLGLPGALPVPNKAAIEACLKLGLALGCKINLQSKFDRKNYFYPDLPKGYQISQYDIPFCYEGSFQLKTKNQELRTIYITRVHMEEDTGKLQHGKVDGEEVSLVDYNRSGVPLIEIVTEPDLHSAEEMKIFLKELVRLIKWLGISDCDMEKGALRLEANISVKQQTTDELPPYKVEIKNVNSFRFLEKAVEYEIKRQTEVLSLGKVPAQETRGFDESKGVTFSQRSKETAKDYRYFPEPDIPPILLTKEYTDQLGESLLETPMAAQSRLMTKWELREDYAYLLTLDQKVLTVFEDLIVKLPNDISPAEAAKQIVNQKWDLMTKSADEILKALKASQKSYTISEEDLEKIIKQILEGNPQAVADFKAGKQNAIAFLIGQVAKATKGQADPKLVQKLLGEVLKKD